MKKYAVLVHLTAVFLLTLAFALPVHAEERFNTATLLPKAFRDPSEYTVSHQVPDILGRMEAVGVREESVGQDGVTEWICGPEGLELWFRYDRETMGHVKDDPTTRVAGLEIVLGASVRRGALILQTAPLGHRGGYTTVYTLTDLLNSHPNGIPVYSPDTAALRDGLSVRVIFLVMSDRRYVTQVYEFRILPLELPPLLVDLRGEESDDLPLLGDGDTTTAGFGLFSHYDTVRVSLNRGEWRASSAEGERFTDPGYYRILTEYPTGRRETVEIYVLPPREEAVLAYFGRSSPDFLDDHDRFFSDSTLPTYTKVTIPLRGMSELPCLYGSLVNHTTGAELVIGDTNNREPLEITEAGSYHLELKTGRGYGSYYSFQADFEIRDPSARSVNQVALEAHIAKYGSANGFAFVLVPYEAERVLAVDTLSGMVYEVRFDLPLGEQLQAGHYSVTEYVREGRQLVYAFSIEEGEGCFLAGTVGHEPADTEAKRGCAALCLSPHMAWVAVAAVLLKKKRSGRK